MSGSAIEAVADYETALTLISQEKLETHRENKYLNNIIYILSLGASESLTEQVAGMASTLSISSSSTLVDAKPPTPRQCVTLPTLPPPPFHSQTRPWKTTAFCESINLLQIKNKNKKTFCRLIIRFFQVVGLLAILWQWPPQERQPQQKLPPQLTSLLPRRQRL